MTRPVEPSADLPASLAARPVDARRGLPIPPVNVHLDLDGVGTHVDFTTINTTISTRLAAERRCGLCGEPMGYWVAFLGTPRAAELLRFTDPPGHPACVTAALTLCPHIALARHRRARADRPSAGIMPPGAHGAKPDGWTVGITRTYRSVFLPDHGFTVHLPAPFRTCTPMCTARTGTYSRTPAPGNRPPVTAVRLPPETFIDSSLRPLRARGGRKHWL